MAYPNNKLNLEKMLLQFLAEEDPMLSMLKWLCKVSPLSRQKF
jgi:hypothetical protein